MPPLTQFGGTSWGDYPGLGVPDRAFRIWSNGRSVSLVVYPGSDTARVNPPGLCRHLDANGMANDQDDFTAEWEVPVGGDA
jgi:hypothetical protein